MTRFGRRVAVAAAFAVGSGRAAAQTRPARVARIIVPSSPGGASDRVARLLADHLGPALGQTVVVDYRPGANNALGAAYVARQPADGLTLALTNPASHVVAPLSGPVGYDPIADFTHLGILVAPAYMLVASRASAISDLPGLLRAAASRPLSYTVAFAGSQTHVVASYFQMQAGIRMEHIPYRGGGAAITDTVAGHVDIALLPVPTLGEHVRDGRLLPLAVTSQERLMSFPGLPTFAEVGYPDIVASSWFGLAGPHGLPQQMTARFLEALRNLVLRPEMQSLRADGSDTPDLSPGTAGSFVAAELARMRIMLERLGSLPG